MPVTAEISENATQVPGGQEDRRGKDLPVLSVGEFVRVENMITKQWDEGGQSHVDQQEEKIISLSSRRQLERRSDGADDS